MVTASEMQAAIWFKWPIVVERFAGDGAFGPVFDAPDKIDGTKITAKRKKVLAPDGTEVISEVGVSMPVDTPLIPPGSKVTLPARFGGRVATVIVDQVHDDGADLTPNFYSIDLT